LRHLDRERRTVLEGTELTDMEEAEEEQRDRTRKKRPLPDRRGHGKEENEGVTRYPVARPWVTRYPYCAKGSYQLSPLLHLAPSESHCRLTMALLYLRLAFQNSIVTKKSDLAIPSNVVKFS
jgi:hypothetical protein